MSAAGLTDVTTQLEALGDAEIAKSSTWFFKTGPGVSMAQGIAEKFRAEQRQAYLRGLL